MRFPIPKIIAVTLAVLVLFAVVPAAVVASSTPKVRTIRPLAGHAELIVVEKGTALPVAGAKYDLYRLNPYGGKDSKIGTTHTTGENGKITVSGLTGGDFCWIAAGEAEGYAADTVKHPFSIVGVQYAEVEIALEKPVPATEG